MKTAFISDTHNQLSKVDTDPDTELVIHAGDGTMRGTVNELACLSHDLERLPGRKIYVAGNHDWLFQRAQKQARQIIEEKPYGMTNTHYLEDEVLEYDGLRIWGSPWQPWFHDWAFNLERGAALREKWDLIPEGIDILITHGPPHGILDKTPTGEHVGCKDLRVAVLDRIKPKVHVFGHIHHDYGREQVGGTLFINASICDERYMPTRPPQYLEIK